MAIQLAPDQVLKSIIPNDLYDSLNSANPNRSDRFYRTDAMKELPNRIEGWLKDYRETALKLDNKRLSSIFMDLQILKRGLARAHAIIGMEFNKGMPEFDKTDALDEMIELDQSRIRGSENFPLRLQPQNELATDPTLQEAIAAQKKICECVDQIFQFQKYVATNKKNTFRRNCIIL